MFPTTLKFESLGNLEFDLPSCLIKVELSETKIFYASKTLKQLLTLLAKSLNIVYGDVLIRPRHLVCLLIFYVRQTPVSHFHSYCMEL